MKPLDQWTWPDWMKAMAVQRPSPDAFGHVPGWPSAPVEPVLTPRPPPDPLVWVASGLPADPAAVALHAWRWLRRPAAPNAGISSTPLAWQRPPAPAWPWDAQAQGPADLPAHTQSPDACVEAALLVLVARGENPWSWHDDPAGIPGLAWGVFAKALEKGFWVFARAMLAHPQAPTLAALAQRGMLAQLPGQRAAQGMGYLAACAATGRAQGVDLLLERGIGVAGLGRDNPLATCATVPILERLLEHPSTRWCHVWDALAAWHGPDFAQRPDAGAFRAQAQRATRLWWRTRGPARDLSWLAHRATALLAARGAGELAPPFGAADKWLLARRRQVSASPRLVLPQRHGPPLPPGMARLDPVGLARVAVWQVLAWLDCRLTWQSSVASSPLAPEQWEIWRRWEARMGSLGRRDCLDYAWHAIWEIRFTPQAWTMAQVGRARVLWNNTTCFLGWPAQGWLARHDATALARQPLEVRQALGCAYLEALVDSGASLEPLDLATSDATRAALARRIAWAQCWLEDVPGWQPPLPAPSQEAAWAAMSWLDPPGMERLLATWRRRALAKALGSPPAPSRATRL